MLIGGGTCTNQDIRMIPYENDRTRGVIEVCINNQWGTVCDDGWDGSDAASAACRQLGFYKSCEFKLMLNVTEEDYNNR